MSRQRGFTLLEVIVAFALLAAALALLLGILSNSARQVRWSDEAGRAALYAQTLIDQVGVGEPITAGQLDGEFEQGRYRWQLRIAPWRDAATAGAQSPAAPNAPRLFEVTLTMEWGAADPGQRLQLRSLRTVAAGTGAVLP
ncbi:prepilin-type N-terminal cleavage/methylation domain-containing protein [Lysobacter sp. LF1]|uniref:Prepilin-type N-terminal cleavage/methylation domain-containing protein n=1 Tax=Lysobacter stagni TaxID=3045172 RepID=A0ABT6XFV7_9GAMM|nr:prepilin-type N-terminal cleavage/methylation domain-containing protein [Lysobacter sp. LF1]MDI9238775.1 prepilin-type N-terminal cleavage/methylation domain-containing protein [Lysobacter sp. LF1]